MSTIHEQREEFADRNLLLHAVLGLISWGLSLDEALARLAPPGGGAGAPSAVDPREQLAIDLVLGLLGARARLLDLLREAAAEVRTAPAPRPRPPAGPGWMR